MYFTGSSTIAAPPISTSGGGGGGGVGTEHVWLVRAGAFFLKIYFRTDPLLSAKAQEHQLEKRSTKAATHTAAATVVVLLSCVQLPETYSKSYNLT